ncbi:probable kinetochore protein SPC25 [Chenopodium quinoa]|uniref:probable kinetochore protein SPC25 n=1 Tax=Chenopodium quinoa TaxID=63459 RepID=UPI000B77189C|nr:probable kinetochore protein SPC25 [Chenopodium quinoa]
MASFHTRAERTVLSKLSELRTVCDKDIEIHHQNTDSIFASFENFLQSHRSKAELTVHNQAKLRKLKVELRELEDELVRALAVKTRNEAKRIAITDSLSEMIVKADELQKIVQDQASKKDEYASILSEQSKAIAESEENSGEASKSREEIQEAFKWYNRVLGFRIDGGHGVTFTFTNVNKNCPAEEYSFTVRHASEKYTLLGSKPHLKDIEELVHELNKSNSLFRFVRIMREKFQATSLGPVSHFIYQDQDCTSISLSAPVSSGSIYSRSKSPLPLREVNGDTKKLEHGKGAKSPNLFLSPRRSPRLLGKKPREG